MPNDFYTPITVDNLLLLTSGEVTPLNAIVMLSQLNRAGLYETYKIKLNDYQLLFTNLIDNYQNILNVFAPNEGNIIFGTYFNPITSLNQIILNFDATDLEERIQANLNSINLLSTKLDVIINFLENDLNNQFTALVSEVEKIQLFLPNQINNPINVLLQATNIINIQTPNLKLNQIITFKTNPLEVEVVDFNYNIDITIDATAIDADYLDLINFTLDLQHLPPTKISNVPGNNNSITIFVNLPEGIIKQFSRKGQIIPVGSEQIIILDGQFNIFI